MNCISFFFLLLYQAWVTGVNRWITEKHINACVDSKATCDDATSLFSTADYDGNAWHVVINGKEVYQVPLAAREGG